jgi:hypothetical protein
MKTYYKITNITNLAGKRDSKFNMVVNIEYIDNRIKKVINLKAGDFVFLGVDSLPLSVHRLRIKKLINIDEINATEFAKLIKKPKPQSIPKLKSSKKSVIEKNKEPVVVEKSKKLMVGKKTTTTKKKTVGEQ